MIKVNLNFKKLWVRRTDQWNPEREKECVMNEEFWQEIKSWATEITWDAQTIYIYMPMCSYTCMGFRPGALQSFVQSLGHFLNGTLSFVGWQ